MTGKPVDTPINPDITSFGDKGKALEAVNMIKEKTRGEIKRRT